MTREKGAEGQCVRGEAGDGSSGIVGRDRRRAAPRIFKNLHLFRSRLPFVRGFFLDVFAPTRRFVSHRAVPHRLVRGTRAVPSPTRLRSAGRMRCRVRFVGAAAVAKRCRQKVARRRRALSRGHTRRRARVATRMCIGAEPALRALHEARSGSATRRSSARGSLGRAGRARGFGKTLARTPKDASAARARRRPSRRSPAPARRPRRAPPRPPLSRSPGPTARSPGVRRGRPGRGLVAFRHAGKRAPPPPPPRVLVHHRRRGPAAGRRGGGGGRAPTDSSAPPPPWNPPRRASSASTTSPPRSPAASSPRSSPPSASWTRAGAPPKNNDARAKPAGRARPRVRFDAEIITDDENASAPKRLGVFFAPPPRGGAAATARGASGIALGHGRAPLRVTRVDDLPPPGGGGGGFVSPSDGIVAESKGAAARGGRRDRGSARRGPSPTAARDVVGGKKSALAALGEMLARKEGARVSG